MYFYEVLISSQRYHGSEPLTYSSQEQLRSGMVVAVPMGPQTVLGIVIRQTTQPSFVTRSITSTTSTRPLPPQILALHQWLLTYYPAPLGLVTQLFLPSSLTTKARKKTVTHESSRPLPQDMPPLTDEQASVVNAIAAQDGSFLLHGDTGSGKTRVYMELAKQSLEAGKSVCVLTPEIGLTPQLVSSFESAFPGHVHTIHSTQTPAQRRDSWQAIMNNSGPQIVIGPRSALFSPLSDIGLIVVDEAHDAAYKQEQMPYYQATRVAAKLAELHGAKLVLGTATPLVQDYYAFVAKKLPILRMEHLAIGKAHPNTLSIVDVKERENFSRSPWLSNILLDEIGVALRDGMQSLIFLNRRGTARLVLCKQCAWQATCPHCDLPLTYHGDHYHLRCHTCGYTSTPPSDCPTCHSTDIQFKSVGTKTIVDELIKKFPRARIQRFDSDTLKSERLESNYEAIRTGAVDILVGTQMLTKGLDLPRLQFVGVVAADTSLYFPDYTAEERTYQMLRQVMGRVGRGHQAGSVVVQTYYPQSPTIQAAVHNSYELFYEAQLKEREIYGFPPYYFILKISVERANATGATRAAHELAEHILRQGHLITVSGPSPAFIEKAHNKYRWQLIIKAKQRSELVKIIKKLPKNCQYDIDPSNLL